MIRLECIKFLDFRIPSTIWIKNKKVLFIIMYLLKILILIIIADHRVYFLFTFATLTIVICTFYIVLYIHICVRMYIYVCTYVLYVR